MENYLEANKITKAGLARIYELTKAVVENKMKQEEAVQILLEEIPIYAATSYKYNVLILKSMLEGSLVKIHTSTDVADYFTRQVGNDYGTEAIKKSLKSYLLNIQYYYEQTGNKSTSMRNALTKIAEENHIDISFGDEIFEGHSVKQKKNIWVFQGNPKYYDVIRAIDELDSIVWGVNQNEKKIKAGDKVYIWQSGKEAGIVASGTITTDPAMHKPEAEDPYNISFNDEKDDSEYLAVDIDIERRFTKNIIYRSLLKADKRTNRMEVITYPGATNFRVKDTEDTVIESIIDGSYQMIPLDDVDEEESDTVSYWMYAPGDNASEWDEFRTKGIMGIAWDELGDLDSYMTKVEMQEAMQKHYAGESTYKNSALCTYQFSKEIKVGDIVYVKKGNNLVLGRGIIESEYMFDSTRNTYKNIRKVKWTNIGEWNNTYRPAQKTLTNITPYLEVIESLEKLFEESMADGLAMGQKELKSYCKEDFLQEVFMSEDAYDTLVELISIKKNVILQGAPGVGKTFAAKRLAYSIMQKIDTDRVKMVQFHQSYSYEDFILGYRPDENGFSLQKGPFYQFCKLAEEDTDNQYFFIIDEINRGNMSKIFGELLMLIEADKRGINHGIQLIYGKEKFSVPKNLYIIGMMNTADRSLAMIDYALRRRFAFVNLEPGFNTDGFKYVIEQADNDKFTDVIQVIKEMNEFICNSELGSGFQIGHSYFCTNKPVGDRYVENIIRYEIIPLIKEYWFDEIDSFNMWSSRLEEVVK